MIKCSVLQENCGVYVFTTLPLLLWDTRHFIRKIAPLKERNTELYLTASINSAVGPVMIQDRV